MYSIDIKNSRGPFGPRERKQAEESSDHTACDKAARVVITAEIGDDDARGVGGGMDELVVAYVDADVADIIGA